MRKGGGQAKGASFERLIAEALSLWLTNGTRKDTLRRNITSGGRFTTGAKRGELHGVPGDLSISHPLAAAFCSTFLVECKFYADLDWDVFLYNRDKTSFLHKVIALCREQAKQASLQWLIIAKQNRREPVVLMEYETGMAANDAQIRPFTFHAFHSGEFFAMPFADLIDCVGPALFTTIAREIEK